MAGFRSDALHLLPLLAASSLVLASLAAAAEPSGGVIPSAHAENSLLSSPADGPPPTAWGVEARAIDGSSEPNPYQQAIDLGANVVLVGNYTVVNGEDILLMARMIDAETQQVLATAEDVVKDVEIPVRPGW